MALNPAGPLAGLHTPRLEARHAALEKVFSEQLMAAAWKDYVRKGLREQEVIDLFDYNDFHWARADRFRDLKGAIMDGRYKPSNSIPTKLEKNLGVCRTVVTPSPEDCVVLQCIVESFLPKAIKKQPTKNAFFSRSHQNTVGKFTFGKDYIWFKQWRRFSKLRFQITSAHPWVVTTDIATFFDNIHYTHLRNIISTFDDTEEVILDVLFAVLDSVSWRPDYLPSSGIGVPQVQFDAPRLLAHVYLFEIDAFLKRATMNNFVRWVDDITFAVASKEQGKRILRDLDTLLQMRGVRLNAAKTQVLSASAARRFFHQRENEYLDRVKASIETAQQSGKSTRSIETRLSKSFEKFVARRPYGHSEKITKRYIGHFHLLGSDAALDYALESFEDHPGLRDTVYRYVAALPPTSKTLTAISRYLFGGGALDDASQCQLAIVLTEWEVASGTPLFKSLKALSERMADQLYIGREPFRFLSALWMITKYSTQKRLKDFVEEFADIWQHSEFLSRQVTAASGKFRNPQLISWFAKQLERHSFRSALSVLGALTTLRSYTTSVPSDVRLYVLNGNNPTTYSLQRFLVAFAILSSKSLNAKPKADLKAALLTILKDPHYVKVITAL
jgi:hypothetical protein